MEYLASLNQSQITYLAARLNVIAAVVGIIWWWSNLPPGTFA